jgi:hypothetical protein
MYTDQSYGHIPKDTKDNRVLERNHFEIDLEGLDLPDATILDLLGVLTG